MTNKTNGHHKSLAGWLEKFTCAFRGLAEGMRGQSSFVFHAAAVAIVITAGFLLGLDHVRFCILLLCIFSVLTAEMINSSLEAMARGITDQPNDNVRRALDIASGAVLMASLGTVIVGAVIFITRIVEMVNAA